MSRVQPTQGAGLWEAVRAVRCPASDCRTVFPVPLDALGRNVHCLQCGTRFSARPVEADDAIHARRQAVARRGAGAALERLPLAALVDNVRSLWNVGSIFRTADACGVEQLLLGGITGCPPRPQIAKTALGAEAAVRWVHEPDALRALERALEDGYEPVALERAPGSRPLHELAWPDRPCLVVGNEVAGISPPVLDACRVRAHVPMRGIKESLNVAVAFGIAAHEACRILAARGRKVAIAILAACALAPGIAAADQGPPVPEPGAPLVLPVTLGKVWYRTEKKAWGGLKPHRMTGDLTLTAKHLDFVSRKGSVSLPLESLSIVSLGHMQGDVNSLWIVAEVVEAGTRRIVGFRDGSQLGYGQRTEAMYDTLRRGLKQLGAAQFGAAPGFEPYYRLDIEFALAHPEGWHVFTEDVAFSGLSTRRVSLIFSPEEIDTGTAVERARRGVDPAFLLRRADAPRGAQCDGFSEAAHAKLLEALAADLQADAGSEVVEAPKAEPQEIAGCNGVRLLGASRTPDGHTLRIDRRAVAHEDALVTLDLRGPKAPEPEQLARFEGTVDSLKFAVAERADP